MADETATRKEKWVVRSRRLWAAAIPLVLAGAEIARASGYPVPTGEGLEKGLEGLGQGMPLIVETGALLVAGASGLWSLLRPDDKEEGTPAQLRLLPAVVRRVGRMRD